MIITTIISLVKYLCLSIKYKILNVKVFVHLFQKVAGLGRAQGFELKQGLGRAQGFEFDFELIYVSGIKKCAEKEKNRQEDAG